MLILVQLGEIDTHLSRHPLIRENVTLVRRDKDEEPNLVSYFVPEIKSWEEWQQKQGKSHLAPPQDNSMATLLRTFETLRNDIRDYLKTKLPIYAVPTVLVPLISMPLNPNGKVDKRALPFPEPGELRSSMRRPSYDQTALSDTEKKIAKVWAKHLSNVVSARTVAPEDNFFDLGGHSLIAQYVLLDLRTEFSGVNLSLGALFQSPTLRGFATEIERLRDPLGLEMNADDSVPKQSEFFYSSDRKKLSEELPAKFQTTSASSTAKTVFITGGTGFLGSHIIHQLCRDKARFGRIIVHARAKSAQEGLDRVRNTCKAYGLECDDRVECLVGDLEKPRLGIEKSDWANLTGDVDVIIHNGARVHWVLDYSTLRASNVVSTVELLKLCSVGRAKEMVFISSTSVLDTDHFLKGRNLAPLPESDELIGSEQGLHTGYGQSKW